MVHVKLFRAIFFGTNNQRSHVNFYCQQVEDDSTIAPEATEAGYQFDPSLNIPNEGFKF